MEIKVSVSTGYAGCSVEETFSIDREEWEEMSDGERDDMCLDFVFKMIEWGYTESEK